jgi:sulfate-transporting ATPase
VEMAMDALRVPPGDMDVARISGGERRRVALCRLLLSRPDMLLLDEPTNHLDAESVAWLERYLKEYPGTIVAVTHDRYFLDNVAGWILELDRGHGIPWEGNYTSWLEQKGTRLQQEEKADLARRRTLERELEWVRLAPRARQAKSKARLQAYETMLQAPFETRAEALQIAIPPGPRLGDVVIEAEHVSKAYGDRVLIDDLSFRLPPGGIVGVVGPNGAGKTTLFRMIVGPEAPDAGTLRLGQTVQLAHVDQTRETLDPAKTVWEEISGGQEHLTLGGRRLASRAYVASFNFKGPDQQKRVGELSGGERNRLHLAKMLRSGANVLLLDEPTNDLDVDTLRALEDALLEFAGCAVVISHDRWFLDRIATHLLAFEDEGRVVWVEGNYSDYEADRKRRLGAEAALAVGLVVLVVAFEPDHFPLVLEGEHVRGDAVEEPPVVADDDGAPRELEEPVFERAQRVHVEVVGRLVEQQQVRAALQGLRQVEPVTLAAGELPHPLLLVGAFEVELGDVRP